MSGLLLVALFDGELDGLVLAQGQEGHDQDRVQQDREVRVDYPPPGRLHQRLLVAVRRHDEAQAEAEGDAARAEHHAEGTEDFVEVRGNRLFTVPASKAR